MNPHMGDGEEIAEARLGTGPAAFIRPQQILIEESAADAVERWGWTLSVEDGFRLVRLASGVDPCELAAELRAAGHRASPNHVLVGQPLYWGGPSSRPFPAPFLTPPPDEPASGVTVAVLDTGITEHPWWRESAWYAERPPGADESPAGAAPPVGQAGHGTFVAGLVLRRAPGVRLRIGRVLDTRGVTDEATLLRALARLRVDPPDVLNLSLGGHTVDDQPSPLLAAAVAALPRTVVVACAGNTASDRPMWPAALPGVIAVAALDAAGERAAPFTAFGPWVDACARGEWLASSYFAVGEFAGYARWSGTSFATALVSGAIADATRETGDSRVAAARVLDPARNPELPSLGVHVPDLSP